MFQVSQALAQESSRGQQHQRHRDLRDHQRLLCPGAPCANRTARAPQRIRRVGMRGHPRRSDSKNDSGQHRYPQREQQDRPGWRRLDRHVVIGTADLEGQVHNHLRPGIGHGDAQNSSDDRQQHRFDQYAAHQPPSRSAQRDANGRLRAILQTAREHQIRQVRAGHQQHTSRGDQQQLEPILVLIPHDLHARAAWNQVQRLLRPELLLARLHIRHMAGQPVMEFHLQFCFERLRIHSRAHSSNQVQEVAVRPFQASRLSVDQ